MNGQGVMAFVVKTDKESLKTLIHQTVQVYAQAQRSGIQVVDGIVVFGGVKDIVREVKKLDGKKRFQYLLIYSPYQITKSRTDYLALEQVLKDEFKVEIRYLRA